MIVEREALKLSQASVLKAGGGIGGLATALNILDERCGSVFVHLSAMGERLKAGIVNAKEQSGYAIVYSDPPSMPSLRFVEGANDLTKGRAFSAKMARNGIVWHPMLNHFTSLAHEAADIDTTIEAARQAFSVIDV